MSWTCVLLRFGLGEKPTLQVGIIAKKVAGATAGVGNLAGGLPVAQGASVVSQLQGSPSAEPGGATERRSENVNPQNPVRLRTHRTFRKLGAPCHTARPPRRTCRRLGTPAR